MARKRSDDSVGTTNGTARKCTGCGSENPASPCRVCIARADVRVGAQQNNEKALAKARVRRTAAINLANE